VPRGGAVGGLEDPRVEDARAHAVRHDDHAPLRIGLVDREIDGVAPLELAAHEGPVAATVRALRQALEEPHAERVANEDDHGVLFAVEAHPLLADPAPRGAAVFAREEAEGRAHQEARRIGGRQRDEARGRVTTVGPRGRAEQRREAPREDRRQPDATRA
jgi:hypothetical protein